jgi:hypothetical protein
MRYLGLGRFRCRIRLGSNAAEPDAAPEEVEDEEPHQMVEAGQIGPIGTRPLGRAAASVSEDTPQIAAREVSTQAEASATPDATPLSRSLKTGPLTSLRATREAPPAAKPARDETAEGTNQLSVDDTILKMSETTMPRMTELSRLRKHRTDSPNRKEAAGEDDD